MGQALLDQAEHVLRSLYGYTAFRPGQQKIIESILNKEDALVVMPTGGGKSLCYQIPAAVLEGVTLVISPLIALMKDQVDAVNEIGIRATYINSSLSKAEERKRLKDVADGNISLLYVAPERLYEPSFQAALAKQPLALIAIDEAHCMSQWGHDFRPSYLTMANWIESLPEKVQVVALTATATPDVARDICRRLHIDENNQHLTGFKRTNLTLRVLKGQKKIAFLQQYVEANQGVPGIIYASTRKEAEAIYRAIDGKTNAVLYHGGLPEKERTESQEAFVYDRADVMVATNAFGMGVNKANVRYVLHANMPGTLEAYYQEAGRAGRDGEPSECMLLYQAQDVQTQRFFIEQSDASEEKRKHDFEKLQWMSRYAHTNQCLEQFILSYFGEDAGEPCGKCSNCKREGEQQDVTRDAQKVLSCVVRVKERFGKTVIAQVLTGSKNKKIEQLGLDKLSTYGLMKDRSAKEVQAFIDFLLAEQYIGLTPASYPTIQLLPKGAAVLKGEGQVYQYKETVERTVSDEDPIFAALRAERKALADEQGIPPYLIFSDKTLREMAAVVPQSLETLATISGVGEHKLSKYGEAFLKTLTQFEKRENTGLPMDKAQSTGHKRVSREEVIKHFEAGQAPAQIAATLGFSEQTIVKHLIAAEKNNETTGVAKLVEKEKAALIRQAIKEVGSSYLKPIKEHAGEGVSYTEIRIVIELG